MRTLILAVLAITATTACSSTLRPSHLSQPADAAPFPTSQPGDRDSATDAAVTNRDSYFYALTNNLVVSVVCEMSSSFGLVGASDLQNGSVGKIEKGEVLHVNPAPGVTHAPGQVPISGTVLHVVSDDGHTGLMCGDNVTFIDPTTAPTP